MMNWIEPSPKPSGLYRALKVLLLTQKDEKRCRREQNRIKRFYPATGRLARQHYPKHLAFFRLGADHDIRGLIAANRVGKTEGCGGYELTLHLTGEYPDWWEGARFDAPIRAWVAGDTRQTTRDIIQQKLMGDWARFGTGLIPAKNIVKWTPKPGVPEAVETVRVQHHALDGRPDGVSLLGFKSYDQGREAFQGTEQDVIWLDEESDAGIRNECLLRLMTTQGLLIETFTPLKGLTPTVLNYMPEGHVQDESGVIVSQDKALVQIGWDDAPHLKENEKRKMLGETPPHLRDARSKGAPSLGSGAIYPVPESEFVVDDMPIPLHWRRAYALDVGWNRTAALWGAIDGDADVLYLYAEHYRGQAEPPIHAAAIKARGDWIPGVIDPAGNGRAQKDGEQLMKSYRDLGLVLTKADNAVESGIYEVWTRLSTGRLKVFCSLRYWLTEYRMYRRDEKGQIVKENDHLMDDTRYLVKSGLKVAKAPGPDKRIAPPSRGRGDGTGL